MWKQTQFPLSSSILSCLISFEVYLKLLMNLKQGRQGHESLLWRILVIKLMCALSNNPYLKSIWFISSMFICDAKSRFVAGCDELWSKIGVCSWVPCFGVPDSLTERGEEKTVGKTPIQIQKEAVNVENTVRNRYAANNGNNLRGEMFPQSLNSCQTWLGACLVLFVTFEVNTNTIK